MSIELVMPSNHLILCCPFLLLPSIFPSIRVFSIESLFTSGSQFWSFNFNISPSNEYLGLISFRIDWFDLLAVQGTLESVFQHQSLFQGIHSSNQVAKVLEFQLQHQSFQKVFIPLGILISFKIDWLDLLAVQGTLKNLLQHHSSKASILLCSLSL